MIIQATQSDGQVEDSDKYNVLFKSIDTVCAEWKLLNLGVIPGKLLKHRSFKT